MRAPLCTVLLLAPLGPALPAQEADEPAPVHRAVGPEDLPPELRAGLAGLDPGAAGWDSEVESAAAAGQLDVLFRACLETLSPEAVEPLLSPRFAATELVLETPAALDLGWVQAHEGVPPKTLAVRDADWLYGQIGAWLRFPSAGTGARWKIKTVSHRALPGGGFETHHELQASGVLKGTARQVNARWRARWDSEGEGPPRLSELTSLMDRVLRSHKPRLFEDATERVLLGPTWQEQLSPSLPFWRERLDAALGVGFLGHHGLAVGDVNNDGLEDLYVCQPGGLPNCLYLRRPDGTAVNAARLAGVDLIDPTTSALLVDLEGDGDRDLVLATSQELVLFENDGTGRFQPVQRIPAPHATSLAAADPDQDGDVDVFACGYLSPYRGDSTPLPYHDAENGQANVYLENGGDWTFTDRTAAVGLADGAERFSFAASWEDYDLDGDVDLYVANDFGRNALYRNDGGQFTNVAAELGVEDVSAGMGVAWADYDGDLRPDLYVSNMYSAAGGRIAYQRRFQEAADEATRGAYQRHARGNSLFLNRGEQGFVDVQEAGGAALGRWAWGSIATDFQLDGIPDLFVPNGFVTGREKDDL